MSVHYTVEPYDIEGGAEFTVEGLQAALEAVYRAYGGRLYKPSLVRPALTAGGGMALLRVEVGQVIIRSDGAATRLAETREAQDYIDGRLRQYVARVYVSRETSGVLESLEEGLLVAGYGLMGLFEHVACVVKEASNMVPSGLHKSAIEKRERTIRMQISRARSIGREGTMVNIPPDTGIHVGIYVLSEYADEARSEGETVSWQAPDVKRK